MPEIRERVINDMLAKIDPDLASLVATNVGMTAPKPSSNGVKSNGKSNGKTNAKTPVPFSSPALSLLNPLTGVPGDVTGRKVAILVAPGSSSADVESMKAALVAAGAEGMVLSAIIGTLKGEGGPINVDRTLMTMPSVMFDAVYLPGGAAGAAVLAASGDARHFVSEAYKHAKAIAAADESAVLLAQSQIGPLDDANGDVIVGQAADIADAFIEAIGQHRVWARTGLDAVPA